ncbi:MAG: hypothetical protein JO372_02825, partial [Solirubrobacterales bacterium]|nr:hypothetical protein [Solirubrobacterales bacterium]
MSSPCSILARESGDDFPESTLMAQARLKSRYLEEIRPALMEHFGYSTPM